jgi:hypothetical protein
MFTKKLFHIYDTTQKEGVSQVGESFGTFPDCNTSECFPSLGFHIVNNKIGYHAAHCSLID